LAIPAKTPFEAVTEEMSFMGEVVPMTFMADLVTILSLMRGTNQLTGCISKAINSLKTGFTVVPG